MLDGKPDSPHLVITPYPTRFVTPWKLADGTEVLLRPIKPEDEPMIGEMLATMSEEALRDRFFDGIPTFNHERLVRFTNIDYEREIAVIAELTKGKKKRIIGVGRLLGYPESGPGEFTVLVHNEFHGRGLGFKLVDVIIGIAEEKGFTQIGGSISADNERMLTLIEELGFRVESTKDGVTKVCLDLG